VEREKERSRVLKLERREEKKGDNAENTCHRHLNK
jgi:hypothetical protein